jgi:serine/threonine-protein phosphatase 2A activator
MSRSAFTPNAPSLQVLDPSRPHAFITPVKKINEGHDVSAFLTTKAYGDIMTFLLQLNRAMFPCTITDSDTQTTSVQIWELSSCANVHVSDVITDLGNLLRALDNIIDEIPPDPGPRRFGNISYRKWYEVAESRMKDLLVRCLPSRAMLFAAENEVTARDELESYFLGSFGSAQRLDYGSGHELSFLAFLGCIWKLGGFTSSSSEASSPPGNEERSIVLNIIEPYLRLIRRLIKTYTLEPAGSHGVWGLDDHSFIPYIFGSAQYGPAITPTSQTPTEGSLQSAPDPASVAKPAAVTRERDKNMYFSAIGFIHDVKKGPFWEHSPMLYDISGVRAGWGKINKGMIKMYNAEVLSKFPVVQHFRFGSLFSWDQDPTATPAPVSMHTSNQPIRDGPALSLEDASARGPPLEGTKAPWANKSTTSQTSRMGTAAAPSPTLAAAASRPNRAPVMARGGLPMRSPQPPSRDAPIMSARTPMPPQEPGVSSDGSSMPPPPTRAPWASKPR